MSATETRVLIIEDNDVLRTMLFTILRHQPLAVDTAASADEAMDRVRSCHYALILIDLNMPDDESVDFLRRFREFRPEATTFIIAVRDPAKETPVDSQNVSAILNKPLEIDTLADVVRECAVVVPPPEDPLPCPPAESDIRLKMDREGTTPTN